MVPFTMPYKIFVTGLTDIGLVRQNNEDFWAQLPEEQFFVLSDGMGGHQAGEVAAKEAVHNMCLIFKEKYFPPNKSAHQARQIVSESIKEVNHVIYSMSFLDDDLKGMGTTLCCILLHPSGLIYGHVGDSRIYLFRRDKLKRLTQDHSLVRELLDMGQINEEQAEDFAHKNIITRAIGTEPDVEPTVKTEAIEVNDVLLLCTDGLTDMLTDEEIQKILRRSDAEEMAKNLIRAAKQKGGYDNVTVVLVKIQDKHEA